MFGRKQKNAIEVTKLSSLIADNLHIVGDVHFSGGLRVDGKIEGSVIGKRGEKSLVVLSEKGCIVGRVRAYDAVINGTVSGDLEVEHFLELQPGAKVSGNISYRQLQMECGATVEGNLLRVEGKGEGKAVGPAENASGGAPERAGQKPVASRAAPFTSGVPVSPATPSAAPVPAGRDAPAAVVPEAARTAAR